MDQLPPEIMCSIFGYFAKPFSFIRDLMVWRQINRTTFDIIENRSTFSLILDMCSIRDPANLKKDHIKRQTKSLANNPDIDMLKLALDESSDNSESDEESDTSQFYKSHAFIDGLLHHSLKNQFIGYKNPSNWSYCGDRYNSRSEMNLFDDSPQFHDKVEEWIEAYSIDNSSCILQLLLEISLGKEMIEHLGMRNVGYSIVFFFHKLFEPAIQTVLNWNEHPKAVLKFDDIFNRNLYEFLSMNMEKKSFLKDEMSAFWFEMEIMNNSIPRQIILFIAENFSHINFKLSNGEEKVCSLYIFEELRRFGICVEKLRYYDNRSKMFNFERSNSLNRIVPLSSNGFYLQHFAVWINSIPLLEYCLNVDSTLSTRTLFDYLGERNGVKNVSLNSYAKTYISDHSMFTALHYAILMSNVEMVDILINNYMANPFHKHHSRCSGIYLAIKNTHNILRGRSNEEDLILKIITDKYGINDVFANVTMDVFSTIRVDEREHLYDTESKFQEGDEVQYDECDESEDSPVPLNQHIFEMVNEEYSETNIDPSDEEYEEGLSYSSLIARYTEINQEHNVLKRKRFDPLVHDEDLHNFTEIDVKDTISFFETVDKWNTELAGSESKCEDSYVCLLERSGAKKIKKNDKETDESITNREYFDAELVTSRPESCIIAKKLFNNLLYEVCQDYRLDTIWMPNARMLLQQACERFVCETFSSANAHSQLIGTAQYSTLLKGDMLNTNLSNKMVMDKFSVVFRDFDSCNLQFKILLGDDYDYHNVDYLTKDLVETIEQFESFTIISGADEDDEYIDNMSSCSTESVVSTVCLVIEDFEVDESEAYYSTISLSEYQEFNPDIVCQDREDKSIKYIIEENNNSIYRTTIQFYPNDEYVFDI